MSTSRFFQYPKTERHLSSSTGIPCREVGRESIGSLLMRVWLSALAVMVAAYVPWWLG